MFGHFTTWQYSATASTCPWSMTSSFVNCILLLLSWCHGCSLAWPFFWVWHHRIAECWVLQDLLLIGLASMCLRGPTYPSVLLLKWGQTLCTPWTSARRGPAGWLAAPYWWHSNCYQYYHTLWPLTSPFICNFAHVSNYHLCIYITGSVHICLVHLYLT